jgi:hypothetical protein
MMIRSYDSKGLSTHSCVGDADDIDESGHRH